MRRVIFIFLITCGMLLAAGARADAGHPPHGRMQAHADCVGLHSHHTSHCGDRMASYCCATLASALLPSAPFWSPPRLSPTYQARIPVLPLARDADSIFRPPKSLS